ncbi:MAG: hemolysin III family protein [Sphaerochaetaceae bacterium]
MNFLKNWLENHISLQDKRSDLGERENSISHLVGSVGAFLFMIIVSVRFNSYSLNTFIGLLIYGFSLLLLYSSSAVYHHLKSGNKKRVARLLDHVNIYILIAGTYTPLLMSVNNNNGSIFLATVWATAFIGIVLKIIFWGRYRILHVVFYLLMGWMIIFFWDGVVPFLDRRLLYYVIGAGLTYSFGVIFYALKNLKHSHLIWHIFCLIASSIFSIGFLLYLN